MPLECHRTGTMPGQVRVGCQVCADKDAVTCTPATEGETLAGRQLCDCQGGVATTRGVCGMEGCSNKDCYSGCRTAGYRFCLWSCMNRHMKGFGKLKRQKIEVERSGRTGSGMRLGWGRACVQYTSPLGPVECVCTTRTARARVIIDLPSCDPGGVLSTDYCNLYTPTLSTLEGKGLIKNTKWDH